MVRPLVVTTEMTGRSARPADYTERAVAHYVGGFIEAVDKAETNAVTLVIDRPEAVAADVTVPATVRLQFQQGGRLVIAAAVTVTIANPEQVQAGHRQRVFECLTDVALDDGAVAFTQAGVVRPGWWGAAADGVTDDTAALQAAIDHAQAATYGGRVTLPPGRYRITSALTISEPIIVEGAGRGQKVETDMATVLLKTADCNGINVSGGATLRDFAVDSDGSDAADKCGIFVHVLDPSHRVTMSNVRIINQGGDGLWVRVGNLGRYDTIIARHNGGAGIRLEGDEAVNCNANLLLNCIGYDNDANGITIADRANENVIIGGEAASNNGTDGYYINTYGNVILGTYAEANGGDDVHFGADAKANYYIAAVPATPVNDGSDGNFILSRQGTDFLWLNRLRLTGNISGVSAVLTGSLSASDVRMASADHSPSLAGQVMFDNTVPNITGGAICWYDGSTLRYMRDSGTVRTGAGSPVGSVTPRFIGQEYLDTGASKWYKSTGVTNADWVALN